MVEQVRIAVAAGLVSLAFVTSGCSDSKASSRAQVENKARTVPREVQLASVIAGTMEELVRATGTLAAQDRAVLSVKVPGRLAELLVDIGSAIEAGAVLARVEKTDYTLKLEQSQAAEAEARAVFTEAERALSRAQKLRDQGIVPEADIETSQAVFQVAATRLKQREAELHQSEQSLKDTDILAPFSGVVEARTANLGEFLSASAPIMTVVRVDPIRLRLEVAEVDAPKIRAGQELRLHDTRDQGQQGTGKIDRLSPVISPITRMLTVEADLPNPDGLFRPGSFIEADIIVNPSRKAVLLPAAAIFTFAGLEKVVTIEEGRARELPVKTGARTREVVEILSGVKEGTKVVLNPGTIKTGQPLTIAN